jgi:uncharacterized membrane protein YjgN (DUF898 family)
MAEVCPKCGQVEIATEKCPRCGVIVPTYLRSLESLHRGPRPSVTPAASTLRTPSPRAAAAPSRRFTFHGDVRTLFQIQMVNMLLVMLTLGVYSFWARVRVRRYLLSETELDGDRFQYHGTGRELFLGALKAALVFGAPLAAVNVLGLMARGLAVVELLVSVVTYAGLLAFIAVATVGARGYRLSRTSWRGIRFGFRGRVREFVKIFVGGSIVIVVTFSLFAPVFFIRRYGYLTSHSWFGSGRFRFDGRSDALFWPYVKMLVLAIPTLGLSFFTYLAQQQRHFWNHTTFADARFRSTVTTGGLLSLHVVGILAVVTSLGLAWPWVVVRKWRYRLDNLRLEGPLNLEAIVQRPVAASAVGDSLAGLIDVDFG